MPRLLRLAVVAAAAVSMVAGPGIVDPPAACAAGDRVAVVIVRPDGTVDGHCMGSERIADGIDALKATGASVTTRDYGGRLGVAVCQIDGRGNPVTECPGVSGHWHYWRLRNGKWVDSDVGPSNTRPAAGDVEGWVWAAGSTAVPPAIESYDEACGAGQAPPVEGGGIQLDTSGPASTAIFAVLAGMMGLFGLGVARRRRRSDGPDAEI